MGHLNESGFVQLGGLPLLGDDCPQYIYIWEEARKVGGQGGQCMASDSKPRREP